MRVMADAEDRDPPPLKRIRHLVADSLGAARGVAERVRVAPLLGLLAAAFFVVATIGPPLFGKGVFLGSDIIYSHYPWAAFDNGDLNYTHHGPVSDNLDAVYPAMAWMGEELRNGELPSWDPWVGGGIAGAPSRGGLFHPFALGYIALPAWFAPAVQKLAQLVSAIGFTYLLCRRLNLSRGPALFAGIAFAGSGFMVMWSNWDQANVAALIPALFWTAERFLQRPRLTSLVPIAVAFAAMVAGLFPAVVFYAIYLLVPYVATRLIGQRGLEWRSKLAQGAGVGAGLAAGAGVAAAVIVPFAVRLGTADLDYRAENTGRHLGLADLMTSIAPRALGLSTDPLRGVYVGIEGQFGNQIESVSFVGVTTVVLALLAISLPAPRAIPRGARAVLALFTLILGWATYAGGPILSLLTRLPAFDNSFMGRTRSVLGFSVSVLAAVGLQALLERRLPRERLQQVVAGGVWVGAALVAALVLARLGDRLQVSIFEDGALRRAMLVPALVAAAVAVPLLLVRAQRAALQTIGVGAIVGLLLVESLSLSIPLLPNEDRDTLYPSTPGTEFLQEDLGDSRLAADSGALYGNSTIMFGLRDTGGHAFLQPTWKEMVAAADPTAFDRGSNTYPLFESTREVASSAALDRLGTQFWVGSYFYPPLGQHRPVSLADASCDNPAPLTGETSSVTVPPGDPVRAVAVRVCDFGDVPADARLVGQVEGGASQGAVRLHNRLPTPTDLVVGLPGDNPSQGDGAVVSLGLEDAAGEGLSLATAPDGSVAFDVFSDDDNLQLVYADDLFVYERADALPRVRWASQARVIEEPADRVPELAAGTVPDDTVVLSEPSEASTGEGEPADLNVLRDDPGQMAVEVDAAGDGYVVVSDALQHGWEATIDGKPTELMEADHAGVAVAVPEGRHEIRLHYTSPGLRIGLIISTASVILLVGVVWWDRRRRRSQQL